MTKVETSILGTKLIVKNTKLHIFVCFYLLYAFGDIVLSYGAIAQMSESIMHISKFLSLSIIIFLVFLLQYQMQHNKISKKISNSIWTILQFLSLYWVLHDSNWSEISKNIYTMFIVVQCLGGIKFKLLKDN